MTVKSALNLALTGALRATPSSTCMKLKLEDVLVRVSKLSLRLGRLVRHHIMFHRRETWSIRYTHDLTWRAVITCAVWRRGWIGNCKRKSGMPIIRSSSPNESTAQSLRYSVCYVNVVFDSSANAYDRPLDHFREGPDPSRGTIVCRLRPRPSAGLDSHGPYGRRFRTHPTQPRPAAHFPCPS
jgi:hypothetical protein